MFWRKFELFSLPILVFSLSTVDLIKCVGKDLPAITLMLIEVIIITSHLALSLCIPLHISLSVYFQP